uniref:Probable prefoldin subunit 6 n=1 Tax=Maconellicoccus hirsutus TaxID=177089 RepID=A2I449_MACHI|nr:prefoldin subunit 6-like protein [Maconellicoccus hirsutus]
MAEQIQKNVQNEIDVLKKYEKEYKTLQQQRQQLDGQLNENEVVKTELDFVKENEEVYKMIGKVLIKQDLTEAKQNVAKRIDYIKGEIKRIDNASAVTEMKLEDCRTKLTKLQQELQQLQLSNIKK